METQSSPPCPYTVTVRRNPHRKARATPSTSAPPRPLLSNPITSEIPAFPIQEILAMQVPQALSTPSPENLRVFLRIRPLITLQGSGKCGSRGNQSSKSVAKNAWPQNPSTKIKRKKNKNSEICIAVNNTQSVTLSPPSHLKDLKRIKSEVYEGFSHVFSADSSQEEVYERMVKPLVEDFINGKSGMLAALGPSGSGKTHTVFGCPREPGMVPLALQQIFKRTEGSGSEATRSFYISIFEIYSERGKGERMLDLSPGGADLFMQQSSIKGLQEVVISDVAQAESLIAQGMLKRSTAMTNSNSQSSRSQCIINIRSAPNNLESDVSVQLNSAVLTIVDLAGAEREKRTGNQGARLLESNFINNTSMVFGLCLRSLLEHQRNPKKPLQKHFQNSLLTRYLRDYLEGKKRMALILTIKPGEEDYLDTSFLLKQASPYMKIKFNNVEELSDLVANKRHVRTLPRFEQRKRMKFSNPDACVIEEANSVRDEQRLCVCDEEVNPEELKETGTVKALVQSPRNSKLDVYDSTFLKLNGVELAKRERNNQIMQGFAKALWDVLKQYKEKLEEAENQVQSLRESLKSEKAKYFELDKEMKDLKSHCSCCKEKVVESTLPKENSNSELTVDDSSQLEGHGSSNIDEINMGVSLNLDLEAFEHGSTPAKCDSSVQQELDAFLQVESSDMVDSSCLCIKDFQHQNSQVIQGVPSSDMVGFECIDNELKHNATYNQEHWSFSRNGKSAEDLNELKYLEIDDNNLKAEVTAGTKLSKSLFSSSQSPVMVSDNNCSSVELDQLHTEEDKILLDPPLMPKVDVAVTPECKTGNVPESEAELNSCSKPLWDPPLMPKEDVAVTRVCKTGNVPESEAELNSCSKPLWDPPLMPKEDVAVTRVCNTGNVPESESEPNSCSKRLLDPPLMPKEDVAVTQVCDTGDMPESEAELDSFSKPLLLYPPLMPKEDVAVTQVCNTSNVPESESEPNSCSKQFLDPPMMPKEDVAVTQVCDTGEMPESETELNSCSKPFLDPWLIPGKDVAVTQVSEEDVAVTQGCYIGDVKESESEVNSCSKPLLDPQLMSKEDVTVTQVCDTDDVPGSEAEVNSCSKTLLAPQLMPKEDVAVTRVCYTGDVPESEAEVTSCSSKPLLAESEAEPNSCSKALKAEKPRRRLLPASSVLLRDIGGLDLEDENQKPRGTRGGKKLAADEINRTQGSISLMRLLKSNLRL
ncbi:kinesin-like protein KIN-6 isoform X3 [Vitis riparia]|uniref:kinesin-like protein KIN-6 isoform X3 n=1 Tax=Vitis riparia TaxID=96939 RepID=UPI00155AB729|nr:kinesin-like protein KIN-6 isoform X3 [Vitis riparia]